MVNLPDLPELGDVTEFALAMPDDCKVGDAVSSYREYYRIHKKSFCDWKNREIPEWFLDV